MTQQAKTERLVVCVRNDEYPVDLDLRKIYRALPDRDAQAHGMVRVIDESGEDYLFPAAYFVPIRVTARLRESLPFDRTESPRGAVRRVRVTPARPKHGELKKAREQLHRIDRAIEKPARSRRAVAVKRAQAPP